MSGRTPAAAQPSDPSSSPAAAAPADGHCAVLQVQRQRLPVVQAVVDGLADGAAGHPLALQLQPGAQFLPQRAAHALAARVPFFGACARQQALDVVDPRPALQRLQRQRAATGAGTGAGAARGQLLELAPRMGCAAGGLPAAVHGRIEHRAVARILVAHQRAAPGRLGVRRPLAAQEGLWVLRPAAGAKVVDDTGRPARYTFHLVEQF